MKAHCGNGLRKIVAAALLMGVALGHAQAQQETPEASARASQNAASTAEPVVAVRIVTEDGRVLSEKPAGPAISIGKPLDREQVAQSIRAYFAVGVRHVLLDIVGPDEDRHEQIRWFARDVVPLLADLR